MSNPSQTSSVVLKTALVTLAIILVCATVIGLVACLAFPGAAGDFADSLGLKGIAVACARAAYARTADINDLATVIDRAISAQDHATVAQFAPQMLLQRDYALYCAHANSIFSSQALGGTAFDYDQYLRGNLALSFAHLGRVDEGLAVCATFMRFDQTTLTYHSVLARYLMAQNTTCPTSLNDFLAKATQIRTEILALLSNETDPARFARLSSAQRALYSEINGLLTLLGKDATEWSLL